MVTVAVDDTENYTCIAYNKHIRPFHTQVTYILVYAVVTLGCLHPEPLEILH